MRYDLAFLLCCCRSFLANDANSSENFYQLLGVESDATSDEIRRAYKRKSLQMHPDKLAQRGRSVTKEDQHKFQKLKDAYECLVDPHKRETYDTIGERGMKWLEDPMSMDPQELAHNFTKASILDRSKIFGIFVAIALAFLTLPVVVCLHIDGVFGNDASWMVTLFPLWIGNAFILFYHSRVLMMPNMQRPDDVPPDEWIDPLPMSQRIFSFVRFLLVFIFELLVALKLDNDIQCKWTVVFIPIFVYEATTLYKQWPLAQTSIITIDELERTLGRSYAELTPDEKESIGKRYTVIQSISDPDFQAAQMLRAHARQVIMKSLFRTCFVLFLAIQIDTKVDLNWWVIFLPIWLMTSFICLTNYQAFAEVQLMAAEQDPELFGVSTSRDENGDEEMGAGTALNESPTSIAMGGNNRSNVDYGSVGRDGAATPEAASAAALPRYELSEEEKEKLKEKVISSGSILCTQCCSQVFLLIPILLIVSKLQGASFSSLWLVSPFLFAVRIRFW